MSLYMQPVHSGSEHLSHRSGRVPRLPGLSLVHLHPSGYHAGGTDANAPVAGGADKFQYDTRAKVAEQGEEDFPDPLDACGSARMGRGKGCSALQKLGDPYRKASTRNR